MYRIVFYCFTILLVGSFVYSKPYDLTEFNDGKADSQYEHEIFSVENSDLKPVEHEIIKKEPVIFDLSTQVAKFILYFIKKYCKNNEKIGYLQNLITTKGIGSIFKTNADGYIQPDFSYLENSGPQKIESTKPNSKEIEKQGHAINFKFATAPNYEIQAPTIKAETKTKNQEFIQRVELTTQNIHVSKEYQTPKWQTIQYHQQLNQPIDYYIETEKRTKTQEPTHLHIENVPIKRIETEPESEMMEPMYEYASHGDEYGITEYEYLLPDYDYPVYPADATKATLHHNIFPIHLTTKLSQEKLSIPESGDTIQAQFIPHSKPQLSTIQETVLPKLATHAHFIEKETPVLEEHPKSPNPTELDTIITDWYKYIMPENHQEVETKIPQVNVIKHEQTTIKENIVVEHKAKVEEPGILENIYEYMMPEENPGHVEKTHEFVVPSFQSEHHVEPIVNHAQQVFEFATPDKKQPDNWLHYQQVEPKIQVKVESPQIDFIEHQQPDLQEPIIKQKTFEFSAPDTKQPDSLLHYQEIKPEIKVKVETPEIHFIEHQQPDLQEPLVEQHIIEYAKQPDNWLINQVEPKIGGNVESPQIHFIEHQQPDLQKPLVEQHHFEYAIPDAKQPDNWLHYQEVEPKIQVKVETPQIDFIEHQQPDLQEPIVKQKTFEFSAPDIKQPDNWLHYQEVEPTIQVKVESPQINFIQHQQPDIQEPLLKQKTFEFSAPNTKPDDWLHYQEVEPKIQVKVETPQIDFIEHQQPDLQEPIVKQQTFEFSAPDIKQPNDWMHYQEVEPKIQVKIESPQIHFTEHQQPDLQEPIVKQQTFEFSAPDTKQPNDWLHYQEVEPKIQVKVESPQIHFTEHQQPDIQEPIVKQQTFEFSAPETKQPNDWLHYQEVEPKIQVKIESPQTHFIQHQQPDIQEPVVKHIVEYSSQDAKQPDNWLINQQEVEPKINVNQEQQVHFIDHIQPDNNEQVIQEHTFDYTLPNYEVNAETVVPHIEEQTTKILHFDNKEPYVFDSIISQHELKPFDTKQPGAHSWFKNSIPEYHQEITPNIEGTTQIHNINYELDVEQPQIQERTLDNLNPIVQQTDNWFKVSGSEHEPEMVPQHHEYNIQPNTQIDYQHSTMESPWAVETKYLVPDVQNKEFHLKIVNEAAPPHITLKTYADDLLKNYTIELQNLDDMKPYYKEMVTGPKYLQFVDNIEKMKGVLNVWKSDGRFYDIPNIEYVKKTMTGLSNITLQLVEPGMVQIDHTTTNVIIEPQTYEISTKLTTTTTTQINNIFKFRRILESVDGLSNFLANPKSKQEFSTLDLELQNVIYAFIELAKKEMTADNKLGLLMLLHKIKFIITKYNNVFKQLEWVDGAIENLSADSDTKMSPELVEHYNNIFFKGSLDLMQHMNLNKDFEDNSNIFLTLLNIPVTAQSKTALKNLIYKLFKDIHGISETYPEFKNIKFYLGEQKSIETSRLYHRLMELAISPKNFIEHSITESSVSLENRRSQVEIEGETELAVTTETAVEETTILPTTTTTATPKKNIEKHHNIFREFIMNTDEKTK